MDHFANKVIDLLGGTGSAATFFDCRPPSISEWRKKGIPKARLLHLKSARPDIVKEAEIEASAVETQSLPDAGHLQTSDTATLP